MSDGVGIAVTVLLLALNAFFVGAEFALVAARRSGIEPLAQAGSRRAVTTLRAMENVSLMMAGAQLGITVCSLALGAVSEPALAHLIEPAFHAVGLPEAALHPVAFVIALGIVTVLHVVLGEMVPKNITLAGPENAALWLGPPLAAIVRAFKPLIWILNHLANGVVRLLRVEPRDEIASTVTREEITAIVEHSHREGLLDPADRDLVSGAIRFDTAVAGDLLLPLDRVHTVASGATPAEVERLAATTGVTRFPVRDGAGLGGYVHVKDLLATPAGAYERPVPARLVRALPSVDARLPIADAVEIMRAGHAPMARVVADDGESAAGVIILDDILAGLVGVGTIAGEGGGAAR